MMTVTRRLGRYTLAALVGVAVAGCILWLATIALPVVAKFGVYADTGWPWCFQVTVRDGWLVAMHYQPVASDLSPEQRRAATERVFPPARLWQRFAVIAAVNDESLSPRAAAGWRPRFGVARSGERYEYARYDAHLPITVPAGFLLAMMFLAYRRWAARRRRRLAVEQGLCVMCGYDLRGSPDGGQCPECGTSIPTRGREIDPSAKNP